MWYWSIYLVNKYFFKRKKSTMIKYIQFYCDFSNAMISCVGRTFFTSVSVWDSLLLSNFSIPTCKKSKCRLVDSRNLFGQISKPCFTLNLMCSISCSMSFDDGSEFFSAVSAGRRQVLSKSLTAVRLESLASSTWGMEGGEAGFLVFTARSFSASKLSTPWSRPWIVFSVWISSAPGKMSFSFVSACLSSSLLNASIPAR